MEITFSADNRKEIVVLPVVPPNLTVSYVQDNTVYEGLSFPLNLIGNVQLREFTVESVFPNRNFGWMNPRSTANAGEYIDFFIKWQAAKRAIRIVVVNKDGTDFLNMPCTVEKFEYGYDKAGDVFYTLTVKEYRFVEV